MMATLGPSAARRVAVLLASASPLSGMPASQPLLRWPAKASADQLDFWLDLTGFLADGGDVVSGASVTISPSGSPTDLVAAAPVIGTNYLLVSLAGGVPGTLYRIGIAVATLFGRSLAVLVSLPVGHVSPATAAPSPFWPLNALRTESGAPFATEGGRVLCGEVP
ncbi:MAG TPA: hypothetical protein VNE67_09080 [Acetobacteraceae bacterium]|nr:hypothetical protein [Acetobacteraceae bacterium]